MGKERDVYKLISTLVVSSTIILAIIFSIYSFFCAPVTLYEGMILALLILIATSFLLEYLGSDRKWKKLQKEITKQIDKISQCQIECYENSEEWIERLKLIINEEGRHTVDTAALDASTRSKMKSKHDKLWDFFLELSHDPNIKFRHLVRMRKNLFENLLDRIISGNAMQDSYYAYFDLPQEFSFAAFEIIDDTYVAIRSPYQEGETPKYLLIKNKEMTALFISWYDNLWKFSYKIITPEILDRVYKERFKEKFNTETQERVENKLKKIRESGIIEEI